MIVKDIEPVSGYEKSEGELDQDSDVPPQKSNGEEKEEVWKEKFSSQDKGRYMTSCLDQGQC